MPEKIQLKNINKVYELDDRRVTVFRDFNLEIDPQAITVLIGKSGCGKTTLLRLLAGLEQPTSGEIIIPEGLRIGMMFQEARLMPWLNCEKNVMLGMKRSRKGEPRNGAGISEEAGSQHATDTMEELGSQRETDTMEELGSQRETDTIKLGSQHAADSASSGRDAAHEILRLVGLAGFEKAYPSQLSGGMQQRVALARTLVHESNLILMDEPFGALDSFTRQAMQQELLRIRRETNAGIVFVTHDMSEAMTIGDRIITIKEDTTEEVENEKESH